MPTKTLLRIINDITRLHLSSLFTIVALKSNWRRLLCPRFEGYL